MLQYIQALLCLHHFIMYVAIINGAIYECVYDKMQLKLNVRHALHLFPSHYTMWHEQCIKSTFITHCFLFCDVFCLASFLNCAQTLQ